MNTHRAALVVLARAPWTGGKTRMRVNGSGHEALRRALLEDTLDVARAVSAADLIVACEPRSEVSAMRRLAGAGCEVVSQSGGSLGERLAHGFRLVFQRGYRSVVVIGSDLPDLPERFLRTALTSLQDGSDRAVLGPARDGGYYLIGLNRLHARLFQDVDWSTGHVLRQTLQRAAELRLPVFQLEEWSDVDDIGDLNRLAAPGPSARRTREWVRNYFSAATSPPP